VSSSTCENCRTFFRLFQAIVLPHILRKLSHKFAAKFRFQAAVLCINANRTTQTGGQRNGTFST